LVHSRAEHGLASTIRFRFLGLEGDLEIPERSCELPRSAKLARSTTTGLPVVRLGRVVTGEDVDEVVDD
jgi:hypothetical protein